MRMRGVGYAPLHLNRGLDAAGGHEGIQDDIRARQRYCHSLSQRLFDPQSRVSYSQWFHAHFPVNYEK